MDMNTHGQGYVENRKQEFTLYALSTTQYG